MITILSYIFLKLKKSFNDRNTAIRAKIISRSLSNLIKRKPITCNDKRVHHIHK